MAVEQLIRHIPLIVQETDVGCGEAKQGSIGIGIEKCLNALTPLFCAATMKLIQDNEVGMDDCDVIIIHRHEPGVGGESDILWRGSAVCGQKVILISSALLPTAC